MVSAVDRTDKLNVFISYSRDDLEFSDQLDAGMKPCGFATVLDRHGISGGEDWKRRLGNLILDADTVVFVLSPSSAISELCEWEVKEAVRLGKRIVPAVCRPLGEIPVPTQLADLNYIFFYNEPKSPGSGFGSGLAQLTEALNTDLAWQRNHTRLLQRATEWDLGGRPSNRLLSGSDIANAKAWAATRPREASAPTELHLDYIQASEAWEVEQHNERQRQIAERERLLAEMEETQQREASLREARETANKRAAMASRRFARWATAALVVVAGLLGLSVHLGRTTLDQNKTLSLHESQYLADYAKEITDKYDATTGILLALEALPDADSKDPIVRDRKYLSQAEVSLEAALRQARELSVLAGHHDGLTGIAVSADGTRIMTTSYDNTAKLWDGDGKLLATLPRFFDTATSVAMTPDGHWAVIGTEEKAAFIWDLSAPVGHDGMVSRENLAKLYSYPGPVYAVAITPDGQRVATGSADGQASLWNVKQRRDLVTLKDRHKGKVTAIALDADGTHVLTGGADGQVLYWDGGAGEVISALPLRTLVDAKASGTSAGPDEVKIKAVALTPDARFAAVSSIDFGTKVRVFEQRDNSWHQKAVLTGHDLSVNSVAISIDGRTVTTGSNDNTLRVWDVASATEIYQYRGHTNSVVAVAMTQNGERVVSASSDRTARIWDSSKRSGPDEIVAHGAMPVTTLAVTGDGARIVSGGGDGMVRIWDSRSPEEPVRAIAIHSAVNALAVFQYHVVVGAGDNVARVFDLNDGHELFSLKGHEGEIKSVAFSADGAKIITGSSDTTARIWAAATGEHICTLEPKLDTVSFVALQGSTAFTVSKGTVNLWDVETGKRQEMEFAAHPDDITALALMPDGMRFLTGSNDGTARLWRRTDSAEPAAKFTDTTGGNSSIAVSQDGSRIFIASQENDVRVWNSDTVRTSDTERIAEIKNGRNRIKSIALMPDDRAVVVGSDDGRIRIWRVFPTGKELMTQARETVPRCLAPLERVKFHLRPVAPWWCEKTHKWPFGGEGAMIEGEALVTDERYQEAETHFASLLDRNPALAGDIQFSRAKGFASRGARLMNMKRTILANEAFAAALKLDDRVTIDIVNAWIGYGTDFLVSKDMESKPEAEAMLREQHQSALKAFDEALRWAQSGKVDDSIKSEIRVDRAMSLDEIGRTGEALEELSRARSIGGYQTLDHSVELGEAVRKKAHGSLRSFLILWSTLLDSEFLNHLTGAQKSPSKDPKKEVASRIAFWTGITELYADMRQRPSLEPHKCDLLTGSKSDPYRVGPGIDFDNIDADDAVTACNEAIARHPNEPRFMYGRARALTRASRLAAAGNDERDAKVKAAQAIADIKQAMAMDYPMAFNQMGNALREGEGIDKNEAASIELKLETANRMLRCCWAKVARKLQEETAGMPAGALDQAVVAEMLRRVTSWAAVLGSSEAKDQLEQFSPRADVTQLRLASVTELPPWVTGSSTPSGASP